MINGQGCLAHDIRHFLSRLYKRTGRVVALPTTHNLGGGAGVRVGVGISKMLKFYVGFFYVMGKAMSGELSCMGTGLVIVQLCW